MTRTVLLTVLGTLVLAYGALRVAQTRYEYRPAPTYLQSVDAEILYLDAGSIVRRGTSRVTVVRFNSPMRFVPHHFKEEGLDSPVTIEAWQQHLKSPIVINAGQFDENLDHLGWFRSRGKWIVSARKKAWKALLVSEPKEGEPFAGVIDLEHSSEKLAESYNNVVQSMMLVDEDGTVRVRDTRKTACRSIVAQDTKGRLLLIVTEGAVTLADMARWLPTTGLEIMRAMNLDGGIESQLAVHADDVRFWHYGQYGTGTTIFDAGPGPIRYPLPAVIAVRPIQAVVP